MFTLMLLIYTYIIHILIVTAWPWQMKSMLPTDLIGAQVGLWNNNLHLINGIYNATKLNYSPDNNNLVLWLTTNLSNSISLTSPQTTEFTTNPTVSSWHILATTNSLGGFFCFSKCSAQINEYLYVISPEKIDTHDPTGYLIIYNLNTKQLRPPPINTPYYLNGGTCVVHNNTHLFTLGGYNTKCPTNKFDIRCNDPDNIILYNTITNEWTYGSILPNSARIDSGACCIDNIHENIYLFGGYNKYDNALSNKIIKYNINMDLFDLTFTEIMYYKRSEFNAIVDRKKNHGYLIGGAINTVENTGTIVEVFDMNIEKIISISINGLLKSIRWYGSSIYEYNNTIDLLLIIGGHTDNYISNQDIKQDMTDYIQYLTINNNIDSYTVFPTVQPTVQPTTIPTIPSKYPSNVPTISPTSEPTINPTYVPSNIPTINPTQYPSNSPIIPPTNNPSMQPTIEPTVNPTILPTFIPSNNPIIIPTNDPTIVPTNIPSELPTWAPFTPSPSRMDNDPFIIAINIFINCDSEILIPKIYPPTINTIVYDLLKPKYETSPNLWVKSIIKQTNICEISIDSQYTTHLMTNAIQMNNYANTTLSNDILIALHNLLNININTNHINIDFNFIIIPTKQPTFEPSHSPILLPKTTNILSTMHTVLIDETNDEIITNKNENTSFHQWLYGENNLNWIIILVVFCILTPLCFGCICYYTRYQTQTMLTQHKQEIQKFQTLSASTSMASPDRIQYTTTGRYRLQRINNLNNIAGSGGGVDDSDTEESSDDDVMMDDGDGYTHIINNISPIQQQQQQQQQYEHIKNKSDYYNDTYQHVNNIINNYNQMTHEYNNNSNNNNMSVTSDIDGSTTDYNNFSINNRIISNNNNSQSTETISNYTNNNSNIYNDSDRMEYDNVIGNGHVIDDYKQEYNNHKNINNINNINHKNNQDYLVVKGMGITPSLVPLNDGSENENIAIQIKRRNSLKNNNTNQFDDDYKISDEKNNNNQIEKEDEISDTSDDNCGGDEFQNATANIFSPPNSINKFKNYNNNNYTQHIQGQSISIVELPPIVTNTNDMLKETSNDKQYEDMYINHNNSGTATRTGSITINSEEQHHENTFELK